VNWEVWQLELTVSEPQAEQGIIIYLGRRGELREYYKSLDFFYRMADSSTAAIRQTQ
jgi:hypothetical protein